ncbi:MAG: T9SS type A sorting domain-containing protein [Bacteroidota bacterium]
MRILTVALLCLLSVAAFAQSLQLTSSNPANNAVNVSTGRVTMSMTFNAAVDTSLFLMATSEGGDGGIIANVDSLHGISFSADKMTVYYDVSLSAGKYYFACIFAGRSSIGNPLDHPYVVYFTTAPTFPAPTVSGNVSGGTTGISPSYALVVLSLTPITQGKPVFSAGAVADVSGNFTIPHVPDATYYTVAAKDLNGDGTIDPGTGDIVGLGPNVTVSGSNVTGVTIIFVGLTQANYKEAVDSLNAYVGSFPSPRTLRQVSAYELDTTGRGGWEFRYTGTNLAGSFIFRVEPLGSQIQPMDSSSYYWLSQWNPINTLPTVAAVDSFFARCERSGGYAYRPQPPQWTSFDVYMEIGDVYHGNYWDMVPDTNQLYLGLDYWYGTKTQNNWIMQYQRRFLGDYTSGSILGTTGVEDQPAGGMPTRYTLDQNFPNPFNPSTVISYSLPFDSRVTLKVFNLLGQEVATLVNGVVSAGAHQVEWHPAQTSGVYFYRLEATPSGNPQERFVQTRKMILMR